MVKGNSQAHSQANGHAHSKYCCDDYSENRYGVFFSFVFLEHSLNIYWLVCNAVEPLNLGRGFQFTNQNHLQ